MSLRSSNSISKRSLLSKAQESETQTEDEKELLAKYKTEFSALSALQDRLYKAKSGDAESIVRSIELQEKKLFELEASEPLKKVYEREKNKVLSRIDQSVKEYREEKQKKWKEFETRVKAEQEERRKQATVKRHYQQIDNAMKIEKELRGKIEKECAAFESAEEQALKKKKIVLFIACLAIVSVLATILFFSFSPNIALILTVVSIIVVSIIAFHKSSSLTETHTEYVRGVRRRREMEINTEITKTYRELLGGIVVQDFLGIPEDIIFVDGQPSDAIGDLQVQRPYGSYTRYVALNSGKCFHTVEGCSGARFPINAIELSYNEYKIKYRQYSPCGVCVKSWNSAIVVPEWYPYYVNVKNIADKYGIKVLFEYRKTLPKKHEDNDKYEEFDEDRYI